MIRKNVQNSDMKVKRLKRELKKTETTEPIPLPARPLSAITSIGSPEPDLNEINKESISPETNSTIVSSQFQLQKTITPLPSISQCQFEKSNKVQPVIHHTVRKSTSSKIHTTQSFKRCGFVQNQIYPEQPIETLNSFDRTQTENPSPSSNKSLIPQEPLFKRIERPICQTTYRTIQVKEKSSFRPHRRCCPCCSPCCCLILSIVLPLVLAGLAGLVTVFSLPKTTTSTLSNLLLTNTGTSTVTVTTVPSNPCTSTWSNMTVISICTNCPDIHPYQQYSYTYVAISNSTRITFAFREDIGYFALDTISLRAHSSPTVDLLVNGGFEAGSLSPWIYCNPSSSSYSGAIKQNSDNFLYKGKIYQAYSGTYFYWDGAVGNADYLSQIVSTNIGETYNISFWLYNQGTGINNLANVIFSI